MSIYVSAQLTAYVIGYIIIQIYEILTIFPNQWNMSLALTQQNHIFVTLMSDNLTPDQRHRNMAAIHSVSTKPELILRKALWRIGFRYRINEKSLPGKPDIVLPKYRTVIFIHGCFWHGHKGCKFYTTPKTNTNFWKGKILRNQERDQDVWRQLEAMGWAVIVVWECELKKNKLDETLDRLSSEILLNGAQHIKRQVERRKAREEYREEMKLRKERATTIKNST